MTREEKIAVYERIIRDNDIEAFVIAWHDGLVGAPNAKNWRDWYRAWMRVKDYPVVWEFQHHYLKQFKISVCTVSGNRLEDIKQTLPANMKDSEGYPAEFILVDYGSTDGLEDWVKDNMASEIASKKLIYHRVEADYFDHPRSKNIAMGLGTGDILMNLDADNFIENKFLEKVNQIAGCIHVKGGKPVIVQSGRTHGNISMFKEDFHALGGYDETLRGRAPSAFNLQLRAMEKGFTVGLYQPGHREFTKTKYGYAENMEKGLQNYKAMYDRNVFKTYFDAMKEN